MDDKLRLIVDSVYDPKELNLMDDFSHNICAYVEPFEGDIQLVSVEILR